MGDEERGENIIVGYALESKKEESFLKASLRSYARERGIHFVAVDLQKSESESEGPFHCLIHKLYGPDWQRQLRYFQSQHPGVLIIDSPDSILRLHDRVSMLQSLPVPTPKQVLLHHHFLGGVQFPVIAKPLTANGGAASHEMALVFDAEGLNKLEPRPPVVVLQEFVNHGGVLFKVYVAGDHVRCVKRPSLPDVKLGDAAEGAIIPFSRISNLADDQNDAQMPPSELVNSFATALRHELKLNLFNFDLIRDSNTNSNRFLVIDINYFPGYAKLPGFEAFLTDFFLDITRPNNIPRPTM